MNHHTDPVDRALESLRSQPWTGASFDETLEQKLMQTFPRQQRPSFVRRHGVLCVTLAALFAGGVGFAATGGTQVVKHWIVKLELVSIDGQSIEAHLQPVDGSDPVTFSVGRQGTATLELQADTVDLVQTENRQANVTVQLQATADPASDDAEMSFTAEATANVEFAPLGVAERVDPVMTEIGEAVDIVDFVDQAGEWQELHVVPAYGEEQGFDVFTTFYGDDDETLYRQVGTVRGVDPDTTEVGQLVWPEAGLAVIPLIKADGSDISLAVDLTGHRADGDATVLQIRSDDGQNKVFKLNSIDVEQAEQPPKAADRDRR